MCRGDRDGRRRPGMVHEPGFRLLDDGGVFGAEVAREIWGGSARCAGLGAGPGRQEQSATEGGWRVHRHLEFRQRHRATRPGWARCARASTPTARRCCIRTARPWERTMLFRREQAKSTDVWHVMGLRGTGSDTYTIKDLFVDDAHSRDARIPGGAAGAGNAVSVPGHAALRGGFRRVGLGVARAHAGCVHRSGERQRAKPGRTERLRDNQAVQHIARLLGCGAEGGAGGVAECAGEVWEDVDRRRRVRR